MDLFLNMVRGFCMALADSVPGVSGGTIAFVLGFYDEFIGSLYVLTHGNRELKREGIRFLAKLGMGWVIGMGSSVLVISSLFTSRIYELSSLFLGFSIFSLPLIIREEKECLRRVSRLLFLMLGIVLVLVIAAVNPTGGQGTNVEIAHLTPLLGGYIFVCAMIAICAMVLPGISGSSVLLIAGVYLPVIQAIRQFLHLDLRVVPGLLSLGLGVIAGVALSIHAIRTALQKYRPAMIWLILGLMLGSLYAICMGPASLQMPQPPLSAASFRPLAFLLGAALLVGLELLRQRMERGVAAA